MILPVEIVLEIIKYLHTPVTYRYYVRVKFIDLWAFIFQLNGYEKKGEDIILPVKKYDYETRNVTTAKNLRLVCKDFAYAYGPYYIYHNIGGTFMNKQLSTLAKININLSREYVKYEAAIVNISRLCNRDISCYPCKVFLKPYTLKKLNENPLMFYDNSYVKMIVSEVIESAKRDIVEQRRLKSYLKHSVVFDIDFSYVKYFDIFVDFTRSSSSTISSKSIPVNKPLIPLKKIISKNNKKNNNNFKNNKNNNFKRNNNKFKRNYR